MKTSHYQEFHSNAIKILSEIQNKNKNLIIYPNHIPKNWNNFLVMLIKEFGEKKTYETIVNIYNIELFSEIEKCDYKGYGYTVKDNVIYTVHPDIIQENSKKIKDLGLNVKWGLIKPTDYKKVEKIDKKIINKEKLKQEIFLMVFDKINSNASNITIYNMKNKITVIDEINKKRKKDNLDINNNEITTKEIKEIINPIKDLFEKEYNIKISYNETTVNIENKPLKSELIELKDLDLDPFSKYNLKMYTENNNQLLIISGKDKSGKTTTINSIINEYLENEPEKAILYMNPNEENINDSIVHLHKEFNEITSKDIAGDIIILENYNNDNIFEFIQKLLKEGKTVIFSMESENSLDTINLLKNQYKNINYNFLLSKLFGILHQQLIPEISDNNIEEIVFIEHELYNTLIKLNNRPKNKEIILKESKNQEITDLQLISEFFKNDENMKIYMFQDFVAEKLLQEKRNSNWEDMLEHAMIKIKNHLISIEQLRKHTKIM